LHGLYEQGKRGGRDDEESNELRERRNKSSSKDSWHFISPHRHVTTLEIPGPADMGKK